MTVASAPSTADTLIKQNIVRIAQRSTAHIAPVSVKAGEYGLRFPGCDYHIDLSIPSDNALSALQLSTSAQPAPQPPKSGTRQAADWAKSFFVAPEPPPPPPTMAADGEDPYLRPFRATLAKPATGRVANLTGWRAADWLLHKLVKVQCTGVRVDANGKIALEGSLRLGPCKLPLWSFLVPLHKLFRINMNMRTMVDEPIISGGSGSGSGSGKESLKSKQYLFQWLGSMLGEIHAEVDRPGFIDLAPGMRFTPEKVAHDLRFTADGLRMNLATHGTLDLQGKQLSVSTSVPIAMDLGPHARAPMHVEIGPAPLTLHGQVGEPVRRPGVFYNQGVGEWSLQDGKLWYDDNQQEYFAPEGEKYFDPDHDLPEPEPQGEAPSLLSYLAPSTWMGAWATPRWGRSAADKAAQPDEKPKDA